MIQTREEMTSREYEQHNWDVENRDVNFAHQIKMKELDLEGERLAAKITAWFKIPLFILKLPVMVFLGIGYCITVARGNEPSENFWRFFR